MDYVIENIKSRRSVRVYLDQPVQKRLIEDILEAARFAPSALNKQPWEFIVITNKNLINELSSAIKKIIKRLFLMLPVLKLINKNLRDERTIAAMQKTAASAKDTVFYNAPAVIFIVTKSRDQWAAADCTLAAENMMLAAHSLGLGSCFIGRVKVLSLNKKLLRKIGIAPGYTIHAALIFGYPKEFPKTAPQRKKDNIICWKE